MNWVGGVKRRILMKEEETRRQQNFFARQVSDVPFQRRDYVGINRNQDWKSRQVTTRKRNKSNMVIKRIHTRNGHGTTPVQEEQQECPTSFEIEETTHQISREGVVINKHLKCTSIHSAYSEMLMKMEYQGMKKKIRENRLEQKRKDKVNKEILNAIKGHSSSVSNEPTSTNTPCQSGLRTPINQKPSYSYPSKTKKYGWLDGAPDFRRVLSLSPRNFKGKRIWTALTDQPRVKQKNININIDLADVSNKQQNKKKTLQKNISIPNKKLSKNFTVEPKRAKESNSIVKDPPKRRNEPTRLPLGRRVIYHKRKNNEHDLDPSTTDSENDQYFKSEKKRKQSSVLKQKLKPRKVFHGTETVPRTVDKPRDSSNRRNYKLSDFKRNIVYDKRCLSSEKGRKDKTPYLQNIPVPWIGSSSISNRTAEADLSKSNGTPSDISEGYATTPGSAPKWSQKVIDLPSESGQKGDSNSAPISSLQLLKRAASSRREISTDISSTQTINNVSNRQDSLKYYSSLQNLKRLCIG